ncbi:hypothetical protein F5I97DRAFT_1966044 [Phlebopus sp. FC_14]|nr:hypothetical protein F5I97DRAFT_1966044 [Phlebopus sp. FC_14]
MPPSVDATITASTEPVVGSKRAPSPRSSVPTVPAKRAKAAQACLSCRKHKTRCEMLDGDNSGAQCHRCKVLNLACSFEDPSARQTQSHSHSSDLDRRTAPSLSSKKLPDALVEESIHSTRRPSASTSKAASSWSNSDTPSFRPPPQPHEEVDLLNPERLLPERHSPWGFLKLPGGFDGTMVPMLAMQALTRAGSGGAEGSAVKVDQTLLHVLGRDQVSYLIDIFEERYAPWLNLQPQPSHVHAGPLLRLAQCCVASRHLDPSTRAIVSPQLYRLADDVIFKQQAFNPLPSTDAIHAILVLSLWEPVIGDLGGANAGSNGEPRDGRLIASTAVSMAMNLRLSEAMVYARTLKDQKKVNESPSAELVEALDKARLWFALNNVESMLCMGTGRDPISDCGMLKQDAFDAPSTSTIASSRDMRLALLSQLFACTQQGLAIRLKSVDNLGVFYKEVLDFLMRMDVIERLICPTPVLAEHEVFHFHILQVYYQSCRLIVLVHALMETKITISLRDSQTPWFLVAEHNGINLARSWGHHALVLSEGILVTALSRPELVLLSSAPDNFFRMITFAAIFVILCKWSVLENAGEQLPGSSDPVLARTIDRLSMIACAQDHIAAKCARVIEAGVVSFRRKMEEERGPTKEFSKPMMQHFSMTAYSCDREGGRGRNTSTGSSGTDCGGGGGGGGTSAAAAEAHGGPSMSGGYADGGMGPGPGGHPGMYPHPPHMFPSFPTNYDPNYFMNSDIFWDNDFWSSFMANLSDGGGHMGAGMGMGR